MANKEDFSYYQFEVGRYHTWKDDKDFKPYKPETKKLVWNVIAEDNGKIYVQNLFEYNLAFLKSGLLEAKREYSDNFEMFSDHIRSWLAREYWSRVQYELIVSSCSGKEGEYKLDVYTQVMINWDRFIEYVWNNKKLITKKKLGLEECQ